MAATILLNREQQAFLSALRTSWKMRLYFWRHLPSMAFWKARIREINPQSCTISLPFSWRTQNPFRSIYFSAQAGAAELSSGLLASLALQGHPPVSMLVTHFSMDFVKKATNTTYFCCEDGAKIFEAVQSCLQTGEPKQVEVQSKGYMANGAEVSRTTLQWSFKLKSR